MPPSGPLTLFISYAHRDDALKKELLVHLSPLKRQGLIAHWDDRDIDAGSDWKQEIDVHLNTAHIVLLLVSPDFIASDYCYEIEMERALERHDAGECRVIPIFLRACDWKRMPFGRLQGLPDDAIPVVSAQWQSRDDAWLRVAQGIRRVVEKWKAGPARSSGLRQEPDVKLNLEESHPRAVEDHAIDDSGPGVLLDFQYFESDRVEEHEDGRVEIHISPQSAEEDAFLRALRPEGWNRRNDVSYAHGNHGFLAHVSAVRNVSVRGRRVWIVELQPTANDRHGFDDFTIGGITPHEIAAMRARYLLLGEVPVTEDDYTANMITSMAFSSSETQLPVNIFANLWGKSAGDVVKFLRWSRLAAVFWLKSTRTCNQILELKVGPVLNERVALHMRCERKGQWSTESAMMEIHGEASLISKHPSASRRRGSRR